MKKSLSLGSREHRRAQERLRRRANKIARVGLTTAVAAGMLPFLPASPAGASTYTVTNTNDTGAGSLRQAILDANNNEGIDTITFEPGVIGTITAADPFYIYEGVNIFGPGAAALEVQSSATIDAAFVVNEDVLDELLRPVSISGLKISTTGHQVNGISANQTNLTLEGVEIVDTETGIITSGSTLLLHNSTVSGAIRHGIWLDDSTATIATSTITDNATGVDADDWRDSHGGGIFADHSPLTVTESEVSGNTAQGSGGGMTLYYSSLTISESAVMGNNAVSGDGGGIVAWSSDVTMTESIVSGNTADNGGGGLYAWDGSITIAQSTIRNNLASSEGGGIALYDASLTLSESTVSDNTAGDMDSEDGEGGGVAAADSEVTIDRSTISNNYAFYDGGGIVASYSDVTVTESVVSGNSAHYGDGGGISARSRSLELADSTVVDNAAPDGDGGGIYTENATVNIVRSTVSGNSASDGGGINVDGYTEHWVYLQDSTISDNTAQNMGGGVVLNGGSWSAMRNSTISDNTAAAGGGIYLSYGQMSVMNSTVVGNTATYIGDAIFGNGMSEFEVPSVELVIANSVIKGTHESTVPDIGGMFGRLEASFSLFGDEDDGSIAGATNIFGADPKLGPLAENGGPTKTMLPLDGSPLIDAGDPEYVLAALQADTTPQYNSIDTDQRGEARVVNGRVDIGAVETNVMPVECGVNSFTPIRLLDTRLGAQLGTGETRAVQVAGVGGLPTEGITSVIVNITATSSTTASYLTAWSTDLDRPATSTLNTEPGVDVPNLAIVQVGSDGMINLYNNTGTTNVIIDVMGFLGSCSTFVPVTPQRLLDTRTGLGAPVGKVGPGGSLTVATAGQAGIPAVGVGAVVVNITSTQATNPSYITAWPNGTDRPNASTLNTEPGVDVPSLAVIKVGDDGNFNLFNEAGNTHLLVDVVGYFPSLNNYNSEAEAQYIPINPTRVLDSRRSLGFSGPAVSGTPYELNLTGLVPTGTKAVIMNVTATGTTQRGYITAWAADTSKPGTSNLNTEVATNVSNLVVVQLSSDGRLNIESTGGQTHLVGDIVGYFPGNVD